MTDPHELATHLDAVADLHDSQDGSPVTRDLLRDAANALRAAVAPAEPWQPPEDRGDGYECLGLNSFGIWRHVQWGKRNGWTVRGTFDHISPTAFAPLPEGQP
jgi:hypothetical protein